MTFILLLIKPYSTNLSTFSWFFLNFQVRNLFCVRQMAVGGPSPSIPVSENTCSYIQVSVAEVAAARQFVHQLSSLRCITCSKKDTAPLQTPLCLPGEKPHVCGICGKTFSQSGSRNVHMRKRHGEENEGRDTGLFLTHVRSHPLSVIGENANGWDYTASSSLWYYKKIYIYLL